MHYDCIYGKCNAWLFAVHQQDNIHTSFISTHCGQEASSPRLLAVIHLRSKVDWRLCWLDPAPNVCVNTLLARIIGMTEKTPLFHYRFNGSANYEACNESQTSAANAGENGRKLGVLFGVVVPTLLSMFSVVVFLRIGELKSLMFCCFDVFPKWLSNYLENSLGPVITGKVGHWIMNGK